MPVEFVEGYDEVGAAPRAMVRYRGRPAAQMQMQPRGQAAAMGSPTAGGAKPLPLPLTTFLPAGGGAAQVITATFLATYRARTARMFLTRNNFGATCPGLALNVTIINVALETLFSGAGGIPVESFSQLSQNPIDLPTAFLIPNTPVTITITISAAPGAGEAVAVGGFWNLLLA
jgi:hypothetical protein